MIQNYFQAAKSMYRCKNFCLTLYRRSIKLCVEKFLDKMCFLMWIETCKGSRELKFSKLRYGDRTIERVGVIGGVKPYEY